jgi:adenylylsulfate kinase
MPDPGTSTRKRSLVKALTYRVLIVCLDFTVIYLFTHKVDVALGFMVLSNIYTTVGYFLHERLWERIEWGRVPSKAAAGTPAPSR